MTEQRLARLSLNGPVRKIGTSVRSMRGTVCLRDRQLPFESALERDFLLVLDADPNVLDVHGQPVRIGYQDEATGKQRHYTPDFLVEYVSIGRGEVLYEVKYRSDLRANWTELRPRFRAARRFARENRMRFSIVTEDNVRGPFLDNWRFLRGYKLRDPEQIVEDHLALTLATLGPSTPAALLEAAYRDQGTKANAVGSLWRMLAHGRIHCDMHTPLTMSSEVWVVVGEGTP